MALYVSRSGMKELKIIEGAELFSIKWVSPSKRLHAVKIKLIILLGTHVLHCMHMLKPAH